MHASIGLYCADVDWVRVAAHGRPYEKYIYHGNMGFDPHWRDRARFTVLDKNQSYTLVIQNVTVNDSAYYRCVDDSGLGKRYFYGLTVQGDYNNNNNNNNNNTAFI